MTYLKYLLLLVCVVYAAWPLLTKRPSATRREGDVS